MTLDVISDLLRQGITPEKISLAIAMSPVIDVFPGAWINHLALCAGCVALLFRLNPAAMQLAVNWLVYPLRNSRCWCRSVAHRDADFPDSLPVPPADATLDDDACRSDENDAPFLAGCAERNRRVGDPEPDRHRSDLHCAAVSAPPNGEGVIALSVLLLMFILWLIHLPMRNAAIVDFGWATGLVAIASELVMPLPCMDGGCVPFCWR